MNTTSEMIGHQIIPLFPLGVVLLPQMELPLHIFEERYKVMINECLDQDRIFGDHHFVSFFKNMKRQFHLRE